MPNGQPILQYGDHIILDNCPTHHYDGGYALGEWMNSVGIEVVYLPTYSPELNPIELAFNKLKKLALREEIREVFVRNVHDGVYTCLEELTLDDCVGFFKHVAYINTY
jgi:transposase